MKTLSRNVLLPVFAGAVALGTMGAAQAQDEYGRVISSTPVVQQVAVPREICENVTVRESGRKSGAGALIGGIAGGAMGNAVGKGSGRAVATAIGLFGGAVLGDRIEGGGRDTLRTVQECSTQNAYESQTVGYNVVYEYAGRQYSMQTDRDPGRYVPVNVSPAVYSAPPPRPQARYEVQPVQPEVVYIGGYGQRHRPYHDRDRDQRYDNDGGRWERNWR